MSHTQAQIEAVISHDEAREIASRLIAGAFRREDKRPQFSIPANPDRDDDLRLMAYINQQATAAAQVGEKSNVWSYADLLEQYHKAIESKAATIERCAQVAEDWGLGRVNQTVKDYPATCAASIAAAIRELKDAP